VVASGNREAEFSDEQAKPDQPVKAAVALRRYKNHCDGRSALAQ
jgi:hypothetical protein